LKKINSFATTLFFWRKSILLLQLSFFEENHFLCYNSIFLKKIISFATTLFFWKKKISISTSLFFEKRRFPFYNSLWLKKEDFYFYNSLLFEKISSLNPFLFCPNKPLSIQLFLPKTDVFGDHKRDLKVNVFYCFFMFKLLPCKIPSKSSSQTFEFRSRRKRGQIKISSWLRARRRNLSLFKSLNVQGEEIANQISKNI